MNKRIIFLVIYGMLFCLFNTTAVFSQLDSTATLAVVPFRMGFENNKDDKDYSSIIAESVLTAFEKSKRFTLIDRTDLESVRSELGLQNGEHRDEFKVSNEDLAAYGQRLKADYILTGTITNADATIHLITGAYIGNIGFTIKIIDVKTGEIPFAESFSAKSGKITKMASSRTEAIMMAFGNTNEPIQKFIDKYFPLYAKYLRTEKKNRRGEMREVLVNQGSSMGFRSKQKLMIVIDELVKDTTLENQQKLPLREVGNAEIVEAQPNFSKVKIKSTRMNLEALENKTIILYFRSVSN